MVLTLEHDTAQKFLEIHITGKLQREDYDRFVPMIERQIEEHGKIRLLVELSDFHGWTAGALWEDVKFDAKHFRDIERLAIVGESKWQESMARFCRPFTTTEIRYFEQGQIDDARRWLSHIADDQKSGVTTGTVYQPPQ